MSDILVLWDQPSFIYVQLITVEQRPGQCSLNVSHGLIFELVLGGETLFRVFLPGISLPLRYAGFEALDLGGAKASDGTLVLWTRHALWAYRALEVGDGCTVRLLVLSRPIVKIFGSCLVDIFLSRVLVVPLVAMIADDEGQRCQWVDVDV